MNDKHRDILQRIAGRVMEERGLLPEFPPRALAELERINSPARDDSLPDRTGLLWCSIDNDDSLDLDQLTAAEDIPGGKAKIYVAVADVDAVVEIDSAIDEYAAYNTTSVYTAAEIFPMLPVKLSTNLTSLNYDENRIAFVIEMEIGSDGCLLDSKIYRATVKNHAKLAYNSVASWLEGEGDMPAHLASVPGLEDSLRLQDRIAQAMRNFRHEHGALSLDTIEAKPVFDDGQLCDLVPDERNRAKDIIEDFMIAANGVTARYLAKSGFPSIRRVVRTPKRWDRIVELAESRGYRLPEKPDSKALEDFLVKEKEADALRFPDLSLSVIKLLGSGEYAAEFPGETAPGHFGLAVKDYSHSTAPNRRFPDLITHRLLKAALSGNKPPYRDSELSELARHCTTQEDEAGKVERQVEKSAAALLLESRTGERFDAIVTGSSEKGTWVRLMDMPIEGKLIVGYQGVDVGDLIKVQLISVDVERGYIDFGIVFLKK